MTFKEYLENFKDCYTDYEIDCPNKGLSDLIGIENFTELKELYCEGNNLTDLKGIENLTRLKILDCANNSLINIKEILLLPNLLSLYCENNHITDLKGIHLLKHLRQIESDITNDIDEAKRISIIELRKEKISDIKY